MIRFFIFLLFILSFFGQRFSVVFYIVLQSYSNMVLSKKVNRIFVPYYYVEAKVMVWKRIKSKWDKHTRAKVLY